MVDTAADILIDTMQDMELDKLFGDVAVYNQRIMGPAHVENVANLACRSALDRGAGRTAGQADEAQVVAWELGKRLSSYAIVSADSGTITTWWARQIPVRRGQMRSVSGNMASMANGLPYAIAAQMPPKITVDRQGSLLNRSFEASLTREKIALTVLSDKVRELV